MQHEVSTITGCFSYWLLVTNLVTLVITQMSTVRVGWNRVMVMSDLILSYRGSGPPSSRHFYKQLSYILCNVPSINYLYCTGKRDSVTRVDR